MPVPPGGHTTDLFDLSHIDTATEALIMPGADLLTNMIVASSPNHRGKVTVQCNNQKLEYTLVHSAHSRSVDGNINGKPFSLHLRDIPGATYIQGATSSGPVGENIAYHKGGSTAQGAVGTFDYNQAYTNDPTARWTGHCAMWSGSMGPHGVPADQTFGMEITARSDKCGYMLNGHVGDKPLTGTIRTVAPGLLAVERNVGGNKITQTIQLG